MTTTPSVLDDLFEGRDLVALFSDIDGTIAHYAAPLRKLSYEPIATTAAADALVQPPAEEGEMEAVLARAFPPAARAARFEGIPYEYWRHTPTQTILKLYVVYNTTLSATMGRCLISEHTVLLMELLQRPSLLYGGLREAAGPAATPVLCALITGARTATYEGRRRGGSLPYVAFDAYEGGGKIVCRLQKRGEAMAEPMYVPNDQVSGVPLETAWVQRFAAVTGYTPTAERCDGATRAGPLWDVMRTLEQDGFCIDSHSYDTSFLVDIAKSPCVVGGAAAPRFPSCEAAEQYLVTLLAAHADLELFVNLGKAQVNARGSGKLGAMTYILEAATAAAGAAPTPFSPAHSVALFDDNNDLPFAKACGAGLLPSVAHASVLAQAELRGERPTWRRPPWEGPLGSEWCLWQVARFKRRRCSGHGV